MEKKFLFTSPILVVLFLFLFTGCIEAIEKSIENHIKDEIENATGKNSGSYSENTDKFSLFCKWEVEKCNDSLELGYQSYDECYTDQRGSYDKQEGKCKEYFMNVIQYSSDLPCNRTCKQADLGNFKTLDECTAQAEIVQQNEDNFTEYCSR